MDSGTILVLVLGAGVVALLVWFEVNSRRNKASKNEASRLAQSRLRPLHKDAESKIESETEETKTA